MFFHFNKRRRPELALGLDIGASQIKAALIRRQRDTFVLLEYAVHALPAVSTKPYRGPEFIAELQKTVDTLKTSERRAYVTISCSSAMVCQAEFPPAPIEEIKSALKLNSAGYLRRDFSSYYLDAFELKRSSHDPKAIAKSAAQSSDGGKTKEAASKAKDNENKPKDKEAAKTTILVGGANKEEVDACREALSAAKIKPQVIELAAISVINAFHIGHPSMTEEVVVLVDIGARMTSVNFLQAGLPLITRIMHFGGAQISEYIGQVLILKPQEAEEEKRKMSSPVQELVKTAISPLAREIRSSIDFFERQNDLHVQRIYACGGSATSSQILAILSEAVGTPVECWNTLENLDVSQFNGGTRRVASIGPSLAAAVGVAVARLS
jgi:type IV pilus assembly protein PilM